MKTPHAKNPLKLNRRAFVEKAGLGAGLLILPSFVAGQSKTQKAPSGRLNLALVGVSGKGRTHLLEIQDENVVALCDVDMDRVEAAKTRPNDGEQYRLALEKVEKKGARWFKDYREMFTQMGDQIDAVIIATPDHMHYPIAMTALNRGKHVYCEKPMTHTVQEAQNLTAAAKKAGVITQMGNQGQSNEGTRLVREWIQAGLIGPVREVHSWTNRPIWPQGLKTPDHKKGKPPVPPKLDWNLWLGVAEPRAYDPAYAPFSWRAWFDFGAGSLGDMACHIMNAGYWALDLDLPESVEAVCTPVTEASFPQSSMVTFQFPARKKMPAVTYYWYDGGLTPALPPGLGELPKMDPIGATVFVGDDGFLLSDCYSESVRILPEKKFNEVKSKLPKKTLTRVKGTHQREWLNAIRENRPACSDFSYAGPFTEMVLFGTIAQRVRTRLKLDPAKRRFRDSEEANRLMSKSYPSGWIL